MTRIPVVLKLDSGEVLFAEYDSSYEEKNFVKICFPFSAKIVGSTLELVHWIPFSSDTVYKIPSSKILNMSSMDNGNLSIYGPLVMNIELNEIKKKLIESLKVNHDLKNKIENAFEDFLYIIADIGLRYKISIPDYGDIKSSFYTFIFNTMTDAEKGNYGTLCKQ